MEEITFEDALVHYGNKLQEISDRIEALRENVRTTQIIAESGWQGRAGNAFRDKLLQLAKELSVSGGNVSDAKQLLTGIGAAYAEGLEAEAAETTE